MHKIVAYLKFLVLVRIGRLHFNHLYYLICNHFFFIFLNSSMMFETRKSDSVFQCLNVEVLNFSANKDEHSYIFILH